MSSTVAALATAQRHFKELAAHIADMIDHLDLSGPCSPQTVLNTALSDTRRRLELLEKRIALARPGELNDLSAAALSKARDGTKVGSGDGGSREENSMTNFLLVVLASDEFWEYVEYIDLPATWLIILCGISSILWVGYKLISVTLGTKAIDAVASGLYARACKRIPFVERALGKARPLPDTTHLIPLT